MKKLLVVTAALVAAVAVCIVIALPPRRLTLAPTSDGTIPGILHVHTNRSDGLSGPDEIAAAAARAGLKFVVFTDHGDATREPDAPTYRAGVLCLDGVEISTTGGHYVALDMPASPYPLGGEPRDVVDDVRRLGGFGIAAHPDSPKRELRWREWTSPFDGIELLNPDTSWRVWAQQAGSAGGAVSDARWRARRRLAASLATYPFRSAETIAHLMQPAGSAVYQWATLASRRRVVAIAGVDAHARLDLGGSDPDDSRYSLPLPGYESSFRTLSVHVAPDRSLTGNAHDDAAAVLRAIRNGHLYVAVDGVATPPSFEFTATNARGTVRQGDELAAGGRVTLRVRSNAPPGFTTTVWSGNTVLSGDHHEQAFDVDAPEAPAVFWVEVRSTGGSEAVPWIRSNAIYLRGPDAVVRPTIRPPASMNQPIFDGTSAGSWRVEHDTTSVAALEVAPLPSGSELRFRFGLSGGSKVDQTAAFVYDTPNGVAANDRITFTARAEHPMRISVQLRGGAGEAAGERWQRSVFLDTAEQDHTVYFEDVMPVGETHTFRPPLAAVRSMLFVIDTTNTKPGASGRIWIKRAALQK